MGMFDSFYAELTCPNCGCQAVVEAQTKDLHCALSAMSLRPQRQHTSSDPLRVCSKESRPSDGKIASEGR
jgi:hypothetical protein